MIDPHGYAVLREIFADARRKRIVFGSVAHESIPARALRSFRHNRTHGVGTRSGLPHTAIVQVEPTLTDDGGVNSELRVRARSWHARQQSVQICSMRAATRPGRPCHN